MRHGCVDPEIDFTRDAGDIQLLDMNNDSMIDVMKTTGSRWRHWMNLGRCVRPSGETGEGKFGTPVYDEYGACVDWTSASMDSCVLYRGLPKQFSDGDLRLADMNGDGLLDVVHLRDGDLAYWAGRGNGLWGDGGACPAGTYGDDRETVMDGTYPEMRPSIQNVFLSDVNADGLSDVLQVRFDAVDIWINVDGREFRPRYIIDRTPAHPGFTDRVRFADVDGSGTPDLLWGDAGAYRYMDLTGGIRPRVLVGYQNGLGKQVEIAYTTSAKEMIRDLEAGRNPESVSPHVSQVVATVTVSDSLGWGGMTEYSYHDGYYDGCEAEFRGFQEADVREIGDATAPTSVRTTRFQVGAQPEGLTCTDENPYEPLKGTTLWTEVRDEGGVYKDTSWSSTLVRRLYAGLDGRSVLQAYGETSGVRLYDLLDYRGSPTCTDVTIARFEGGFAADLTACIPVQASGYETVTTAAKRDSLGNQLASAQYGAAGITGDEVTAVTEPGVIGTWLSVPVESWVQAEDIGATPARKYGFTRSTYDDRGLVVEAWRHNDLPVTPTSPSSGWEIDDDTWYLVATNAYSDAGQLVESWAGASMSYSAHSLMTFDSAFGAYPVSEQVEATPGEYLGLTGQWDAGFGVLTSMTDFNGDVHELGFDQLGRLTVQRSPRCAEPATTVQYNLSNPLSYIVTVANETCDDSPDAIVEPLSPSDRQGAMAYKMIDGLGRARATVSEGEPTDPWLVTGHAEFNARGGVKGEHYPYPIGAPGLFDVGRAEPSLMTETFYDAYGRVIRTYVMDGRQYTGIRYGALTQIGYDSSDVFAGAYLGTYLTEKMDGLGRKVRSIARLNEEGGTQSLFATDFQYDPLGSVTLIRTGRLAGGEESGFDGFALEKRNYYDSQGTHVALVDANMGSHFFVYNEFGQLVRWQDGRGVTNAYSYDLAGRLVGEDYGYDFDDDVQYHFDAPATSVLSIADWYTSGLRCNAFDLYGCLIPQQNLLGQISAIEDRSGTTIFSYDDEGNVAWVERQVSMYTRDGAETEFSKKDDHSQIWRWEYDYDELGRIRTERFPEEGVSTALNYSERGLVSSASMTSPSWSAAQSIIDSVAYNELGQVLEVDFGDGADLRLSKRYNALQQLERLVYEQQAGPGLEVLDYGYDYDEANNIIAILDYAEDKLAGTWSTRKADHYYEYDSFSRLVGDTPVYATYPTAGALDQTWAYDKLGSMLEWHDPSDAFKRYSLGDIANGLQLIENDTADLFGLALADVHPQALYGAYTEDAAHAGSYVRAVYDAGGYMTSLETYEGCGECDGAAYTCAMPCTSAERQVFEWDEVGRLQETYKIDGVCDADSCDFDPVAGPVAAHYQHTYDSGNQRVVKHRIEHDSGTDYYADDLYMSGDFEVRGALFVDGSGFTGGQRDKYAMISGKRVARLLDGSTDWVIFATNHLGSTSLVIDGTTGTVIDASTNLAFGYTDENVKNSAWADFLSYYGFTGKEEDADSNLMFFGARYYIPTIGRWTCTDPLGMAGDVSYAYSYVSDNPILLIDPTGMEEEAPDISIDLYKGTVPVEEAAIALLPDYNPESTDAINVLIIVGQSSSGSKEFTAAAETYKADVLKSNADKKINITISQVDSGAAALNAMADYYIKYGKINDLQYFGHTSHGSGFDVNQDDMWADLYKPSYWASLTEELFKYSPILKEQTLLSPLAKSVEEINKDWFAENATITIHGCNAGKGEDSFAQQLADHVGVVVKAAIKPVSFSKTPEKHTAPDKPWHPGKQIYLIPRKPEYWKQFYPNKEE